MASNPVETVETLERDRQKNGYPWPVAELTGSGLKDFKVVRQSTKIAVDTTGTITYRAGFNSGGLKEWQSVFESLAASRGSGQVKPGLRYDPGGPDRNCSDFDTQREAQDFFVAAGGPELDPHRLDRNKDGLACESLP